LYRDIEGVRQFSLWNLALHFIYFQLPLKSRALPFFHPVSFIGALAIPMIYGYRLYCKPTYEIDYAEQSDLLWNTILFRSFLINFAPMIFHVLDITTNQDRIIIFYQAKSEKGQIIWSMLGFLLF
jgi:hypothetical protein